LRESSHEEGTLVHTGFCGVPGLSVEHRFVADRQALAVSKGASGLEYVTQHVSETSGVTDVANGKYVAFILSSVSKDLKVTDNGDAMLTLVLVEGNDVLYGPAVATTLQHACRR
jgi:hypothetical protein